jgi:mRNA interferase MazF
MDGPRETALVLPTSLLDQVAAMAQRLKVSQDRVVELAIKSFIAQGQLDVAATPIDDLPPESGARAINQGDIFWIRPNSSAVAELGYYPHPYVVVQEDIFNHSRISTIVVCGLTSNLKQAGMPGNVLLELGEADLPRQSVVDVAKISSVQKAQLGACIGSLSEQRIRQILGGIRFLQLSAFTRC